MRIARVLCTVAVAAAVTGCGGGTKYVTVTVPPVLDVTQYERAALPTFTVENAKGSLHELATRRFAEYVLRAQREVEVLEVGSADAAMQKAGESRFGAATAKALGSTHDVPVVFAGHLKVSNVKPSGGIIGGLSSLATPTPHFEATVSVELDVALYSSRTGGTLWRAGASANEKVGSLIINRGEPTFSAKDPNLAYGRLVDRLVSVVSQDLFPTYERRVVR